MNIDDFLADIVPWDELPPAQKAEFSAEFPSNTEYSWNAETLHYHADFHVRWRGPEHLNFYRELLRDMRQRLQVYPYHLARPFAMHSLANPFEYYVEMLCDALRVTKSYEEFPNFTAADVLRVIGIHRNNYLEALHKCQERGAAAKISRAIRGLLPATPQPVPIEFWWTVYPIVNNIGVLRKAGSRHELEALQQLYKAYSSKAPTCAGMFDRACLESLYCAGVIGLEIPVEDDDSFEEPPEAITNFGAAATSCYFEEATQNVLNRIKSGMTVCDLAEVLDLPFEVLVDALSLLCRLGFTDRIEREEKMIHGGRDVAKANHICKQPPCSSECPFQNASQSKEAYQGMWHNSWLWHTLYYEESEHPAISCTSRSAQSLETARSEADDGLQVALLLEAELVDKLAQREGIKRGEDACFKEDDISMLLKDKADCPELTLVRAAVKKLLEHHKVEIKALPSETLGAGLILGQVNQTPIAFMPLPSFESSLYQMFKMNQSQLSLPTLLIQAGSVLDKLPEVLTAAEYAIYTDLHDIEIVESWELLIKLQEMLPERAVFVAALPELKVCGSPRLKVTKVALPLSTYGITNTLLASFLRDLNSYEPLEYAVGTLSVLHTTCKGAESVLTDKPCCPQNFYLLAQSPGLPLADSLVTNAILNNLTDQEWFKFSHLHPASEAHMREVGKFRESLKQLDTSSPVWFSGAALCNIRLN